MHRIIRDRGVQASAAAGVTIGALAVAFADQHPITWTVLLITWAVVAAVAVVRALTRRAA